MKCFNCDKENSTNARFCSACGTPLQTIMMKKDSVIASEKNSEDNYKKNSVEETELYYVWGEETEQKKPRENPSYYGIKPNTTIKYMDHLLDLSKTKLVKYNKRRSVIDAGNIALLAVLTLAVIISLTAGIYIANKPVDDGFSIYDTQEF